MLCRVLPVSFVVFAFGCSDYELSGHQEPTEPQEEPQEDVPEDEGTPEEATEPGAVKGRICSPSTAAWVAGADVWIETGSEKILTETDGEGWFLLEPVPAGTWTVKVEKGSFSTQFEVLVEEGKTTELATEECLSTEDVKIAVVTGAYDSIEKVLDRLGFEYTLIQGRSGSAHVDFMRDPSQLGKYDIIFFNCGMNDNWENYRSEVSSNISDYVKAGGSVYTSDWSYFVAEVAFPNMADFYGDDGQHGAAYVGEMGKVTAEVLDSDMQIALGKNSATLDYNLSMWAVMEQVTEGDELLRGNIKYLDGWNYSSMTAPLAVRKNSGSGQMLYTSFHNEAQSTGDMDRLLEEVILSL